MRTPVTDGAYGKPWVFRAKDLVGFWSNPHFERVNGVEQASATAFLPKSKPIMLTEVRIVDADGNDIKPGETGEMLLRGETIMKNYWNKPEETAATIVDGWLHTGDLARLDPDGYMTLTDRIKDMIITGGHNVYSIEVEYALAAHPDVADCAIVARPHPTYGESIVAIVTPVEGTTITLPQVQEF